MPSTHRFEINYLFNNQPLAQVVERDSEEFPQAEVTRYLVALHRGDGEKSPSIPIADAAPEQVMEQAQALGLSDIRVSRLKRVLTPGHYRQP
ncbi:MAG: hypothetical protein V4812_22840 [Pseudomonadota bacterium]